MLRSEQRVGICKSHPPPTAILYNVRQCRSHVELPAHDVQSHPTPVTKAFVYHVHVPPSRRAISTGTSASQPPCQDQINQLYQDITQQVDRKNWCEQLQRLPGRLGSDLCLDVFCVFPLFLRPLDSIHSSRISRKPSVVEIVLDQIILLPPPLQEPLLGLFLGVKRNVGNGEAAPVHVYRFGGATLEIDGSEGVDLAAVGAARNAFVGNGAVIEPIHAVLQLF